MILLEKMDYVQSEDDRQLVKLPGIKEENLKHPREKTKNDLVSGVRFPPSSVPEDSQVISFKGSFPFITIMVLFCGYDTFVLTR
ncbi:hypothetical protein NQZ68_013521 [Dissostichus eleginoides]|nr:hypothetical protein NQZ68_013521 [Dissostichus eleginoides]